MKRTIYEELLAWKNAKSRKPLLLFGARQTGKTYILQQFGSAEFHRLHSVNFENNSAAAEIFSGSLSPRDLLPENRI